MGVLLGKAGYLDKLFPIRMWVFLTGFGPHLIDKAFVVRFVQKRTRGTLQYHVSVRIAIEVFFYKIVFRYFQEFSYPSDILWGKYRASGLTAVGTAQTIHLFEFCIVQFLHQDIQMLWRPFFEPGKVLFRLGLFRIGQVT